MRVPLAAVGLGGGIVDFLTGHSNACGNEYQGTYDDVNCPTRCFVLGNWLDETILGRTCWPCHNVCPAGTIWDTKNQTCSKTPAEVNPDQAFACDYAKPTPQAPVYTHVPNSGAGAGPGGTAAPSDPEPVGCPGFCSYVPFAGTLFGECQTDACKGITGESSNTIMYIALAVGAIAVAGMFFGGRRR